MSRFRGQAVSDGVAVGQIYLGDGEGGTIAADAEAVRSAFAAVARERTALAARLRARGEEAAAAIVEVGALIAADPALTGPVLDSMRAGADAVTAVSEAASAQAAILAALPDPSLAERAGDVRQVAGAVLDQLRGTSALPPDRPFILVRKEVDPADLIRLADAGLSGGGQAGGGQAGGGLAGAVSVGGGASSHAAIVARGLGLPMLAGADPMVLQVPDGRPAILDAAAGELIIDPEPDELATAARTDHHRAVAPADGVVVTADGTRVTLLCNVASAAETRLGLSGGAAGVGLLRTEIPFTGATGWPTESDHLAQLTPVLAALDDKPAVVRLLDFSGDKIPPFLSGQPHGLTALLDAPGALDDQLRAIVRAGRHARLAVLVPMVTSLEEVTCVRKRLAEAASQAGVEPPELGIMVEVAATAERAELFAPAVDFFSIGTNDLTSEVLGLDRGDPGTRPALAADPRVLALIGHVVEAAGSTGVRVSVCGDAAGDPEVLPLLLRLGIRTLSVGAARVPRVASWIAATEAGRR